MNPRPAGVARRLIVLGAAAGVAVGVWPADRPRRIGYLSVFPRPSSGVVPLFDAFFAGMREQGYEEGRDYVMDWRVTGGKPEAFDAHAVALVADGVDLFLCLTTVAAMAAKRATSTIPIVFSGLSDPVTSGLVPSLARPGATSPACRPSTTSCTASGSSCCASCCRRPARSRCCGCPTW